MFFAGTRTRHTVHDQVWRWESAELRPIDPSCYAALSDHIRTVAKGQAGEEDPHPLRIAAASVAYAISHLHDRMRGNAYS
jgi:hypothetical protein